MPRLLESKRDAWTPELLTLYQKFPAAIRSKSWGEIRRLVLAGEIEKAEAIARENEERSPRLRAENVVARRIRNLRLRLFAKQVEIERQFRELFRERAAWLESRLQNLPSTMASVGRGSERIHEAIVEIRREALKIIRHAIRDSARMGLRNMSDSIVPIMKDNKESWQAESIDQFFLERDLTEDRLTFGITPRLAGKAKDTAKVATAKWAAVLDRVYKSVVQSNNEGLTLSQRVFDLTAQTERTLKRMLAREISQGTAPRDVAKKARKYLSSEAADPEFSAAGIYKNPMKNAMRLARTETNRAYIKAGTSWAKEKSWVQGVRWTLSKIHMEPDICDDYADGSVMTPDEFEEKFPAHPHCMCYPVYVIKEEFLQDYADDDERVGGTD